MTAGRAEPDILMREELRAVQQLARVLTEQAQETPNSAYLKDLCTTALSLASQVGSLSGNDALAGIEEQLCETKGTDIMSRRSYKGSPSTAQIPSRSPHGLIHGDTSMPSNKFSDAFLSTRGSRKRQRPSSLAKFAVGKSIPPHLPHTRGQVSRTNKANVEENGLLNDFMNAPIVELGVVFRSDPLPDGFVKVPCATTGGKADLNAGAGGHYLYLISKKDITQKPRLPVVSLAVIFPDRSEFVPPTFSVVRRQGNPVDFNAGTNGERVYLCYKRGTGNPITDICVVYPKRKEQCPPGYILLERTPFKYDADLNAGASSSTIFLCYQQKLRSVEVLEPQAGAGTSATVNGTSGAVPAYFGSNNSGGNVSRATTADTAPTMTTATPHYPYGPSEGSVGADADETRSFCSLGALNEICTQGDHYPAAELGPYLRRILLRPLVVALYVGTSEITSVALEELLMLATKHLSSVVLNNHAVCPFQAYIVEALCLHIHRAQAEHFEPIVQYLRSVLQASQNEDLSSTTLQQIYTTCIFLCNFEAFRALEIELCAQSAAAKAAKKSRFPFQRQRLRKGLSGAQPNPGGNAMGLGSLGQAIAAGIGKDESLLGSDSVAFLTLRNLVELLLRRVETIAKLEGQESLSSTRRGKEADRGSEARGLEEPEGWIRSLVVGVSYSAVQHVELSKAVQRAVACIRRSSSSSHESLWRELLAISETITSCPAEENAFLLLAATCKLASESPRVESSGNLLERDVASKLISLEVLSVFLRKTGEQFQKSAIFGIQIRRLVTSCLLSNISYGIQDMRIQRRVIGCITCLWRFYRRWTIVEFGLLCEEGMFRTLRHREPEATLVPHQLLIIQEIMSFLDIPQSVIELYLNFDLDRQALAVRQPLFEKSSRRGKSGTGFSDEKETGRRQGKGAFEALVESLCTLGERIAGQMATQMEDNEGRLLHLRILEAVSQVTRTIMDASGHAHLIPRDERIREISCAQRGGGWEADVLYSMVAGQAPVRSPLDGRGRPAAAAAGGLVTEAEQFRTAESLVLPETSGGMSWDSGSGSAATVNENSHLLPPPPPPSSHRASGLPSQSPSTRIPPTAVRTSSSIQPSSLQIPSQCLPKPIIPSLPKQLPATPPEPVLLPALSPRQASSVRLRQEQQFRQDAELHTALGVYRSKGLRKAVQYLVATGFMSDTPRDVASFLRVYREWLDPVSIGDFLGEGGPANDAAYWNLIRLSYVRSISFHNMTLEEALRHFLTRCGFHLPGEAQKIDRLISVFAECYFRDNQGMSCCPFTQANTPYILSYAVIILQTDLHRADAGRKRGQKKHKKMSKEGFINNLRHVDESTDLSREYLSEIYDSIQSRPIEMMVAGGMSLSGDPAGSRTAEGQGGDSLQTVAAELAQSVRQADELLQGLAVYPTRFSFIGINASLTPDLVRLMFESMWFHVHCLVNNILQNASQSDPEAIMTCLDITRYAINAAMFLNLSTQKNAFSRTLARFKLEQERIVSGAFRSLASSTPTSTSAPTPAVPSTVDSVLGPTDPEILLLQQELSRAASVQEADKAIEHVHTLVSDLKDSFQQSRMRQELKAVAKRIEARAKLLEGVRRFVREGDLVKKCRSGKSVTYRFFLFSDQLLYTHRGFGGIYKPHAQLLLSLTKLSNVEDRRNCSFEIHHPRKSFVVVAESAEMKRVWMRDINEAKTSARKGVVERQLSVMTRLREESNRVMSILRTNSREETPTSSKRVSRALRKGSSGGGLPPPRPSVGERSPRVDPPGEPPMANLVHKASSLEEESRGPAAVPALLTSNPSETSPLLVGGKEPAHAKQSERDPKLGLAKAVSRRLSSQMRQAGSQRNVDEETMQRASSLNSVDAANFVELEASFADALGLLSSLCTLPSEPSEGGREGVEGLVRLPTKVKDELVGLFLQHREGDCPVAGPRRSMLSRSRLMRDRVPAIMGEASELSERQIEAWRSMVGMTETSCMMRFLLLLDRELPGWGEEIVGKDRSERVEVVQV